MTAIICCIFKMFFGVLFVIIAFLAVLSHDKVVIGTYPLSGDYYMLIPGNGNQYVFNIDWSPSFDRYLVTVTGQTLAWATATLNMINDTTVNLICDSGDSLVGTISYPTDLPSICWPTSNEFKCWNRLLSNITRIHVINM